MVVCQISGMLRCSAGEDLALNIVLMYLWLERVMQFVGYRLTVRGAASISDFQSETMAVFVSGSAKPLSL